MQLFVFLFEHFLSAKFVKFKHDNYM